ncbi:MAG TPA: polysaccharide deacetylase [Nitrolancea sp.]
MSFERPSWPNGAKCAVALTFDNFGESFDLLRHGHAGGANADGVYAPRRGIERVLDLLARYSIPATFFVEGWNAKKYADLAREIVKQGHEIGGHGWMHEAWGELPPKRERDLILRTTTALSDILGQAPTGWRAPSGLTTEGTLGFLREAGYSYDSSFGDDDVPYFIATDSGDEIMELPWSWSLDDAVYYAHPGTMRRPSEVAQLWIEEFDAAYELTGNFMLVCHPRYSGRPARIRALEQLIQHIRAHDGVWFTRSTDLAAAARDWTAIPHHPYPERMPDDER